MHNIYKNKCQVLILDSYCPLFGLGGIAQYFKEIFFLYNYILWDLCESWFLTLDLREKISYLISLDMFEHFPWKMYFVLLFQLPRFIYCNQTCIWSIPDCSNYFGNSFSFRHVSKNIGFSSCCDELIYYDSCTSVPPSNGKLLLISLNVTKEQKNILAISCYR